MKTISTIYSQPAIKEVKKLVNTFLYNFGYCGLDFDDMFYCNVFCSASTYANYNWRELELQEPNFEIPHNLSSICSTSEDRIDYVEGVIKDVMTKVIDKPEWMMFIENESKCDCECFDLQPSNFLRLYPKKEEYKAIGECLIDFLYSPNRTRVVY